MDGKSLLVQAKRNVTLATDVSFLSFRWARPASDLRWALLLVPLFAFCLCLASLQPINRRLVRCCRLYLLSSSF